MWRSRWSIPHDHEVWRLHTQRRHIPIWGMHAAEYRPLQPAALPGGLPRGLQAVPVDKTHLQEPVPAAAPPLLARQCRCSTA